MGVHRREPGEGVASVGDGVTTNEGNMGESAYLDRAEFAHRCYLCGERCESVDHGRHVWCEQEEAARIAAWDEADANDVRDEL